MRLYYLISVLAMPLIGVAQANNRIDSYKTKKGVELKTGDTLQFGRGTNFDGSFKYVSMGLVLTSSTDDPLPTNHANTLAIIRFFRQVKIGQGTKMYASLKAGTLLPAYADIESALDAREITGVNGWEIGKPRPRQQALDSNGLTTSTKPTVNAGKENIATQDGMTVKPFSNDIDIKILSIAGNKSQQTVTVNFVLKTELPHQQIRLLEYGCNYNRGEGKAYDGDGTEYNLRAVSLGNVIDANGVDNKLPTSVPLKGSITFANVLPKIGTLSFVTFYMSSRNYDGGENCQAGNVEIRNVRIDWK